MESIVSELKNPVWWFTLVGAALEVNLLDSFLKPKQDSWASNTSSW